MNGIEGRLELSEWITRHAAYPGTHLSRAELRRAGCGITFIAR
jgi:hypothetical protein